MVPGVEDHEQRAQRAAASASDPLLRYQLVKALLSAEDIRARLDVRSALSCAVLCIGCSAVLCCAVLGRAGPSCAALLGPSAHGRAARQSNLQPEAWTPAPPLRPACPSRRRRRRRCPPARPPAQRARRAPPAAVPAHPLHLHTAAGGSDRRGRHAAGGRQGRGGRQPAAAGGHQGGPAAARLGPGARGGVARPPGGAAGAAAAAGAAGQQPHRRRWAPAASAPRRAAA
jgi:hypothetical protein